MLTPHTRPFFTYEQNQARIYAETARKIREYMLAMVTQLLFFAERTALQQAFSFLFPPSRHFGSVKIV